MNQQNPKQKKTDEFGTSFLKSADKTRIVRSLFVTDTYDK